MRANLIQAVNSPLFIKPIEPIRHDEREERQEKYTSKKKPDKIFSDVLSSEISSLKTPLSETNKLNLNTLNLLAYR